MKKFLAFLGGTALAATVIPYAYKKNEETEEKTIQALLWKASILPVDEEEGKQKIAFSVGFNNPFQSEYNEETELFADEVTITYKPAPVCECECTTECAEVNDCECACVETEECQCCCDCSEESAVEEVAEEILETAEDVAETVVDAAEDTVESITE